ncbi:MAG TPA: hypothetical protein PK079_02555 [Leptospiraceae bacterium]|nr:hypothetical protein [Leptospiraceae bacterium]HMW04086.1 hypothetical protein [Leptospiraceae bacterium]HMX30847.1 hypothetical protein [Leptospiraceae bacterium]HMY30080.1 hypothetical protein [Leptospiraceae bacterium]HMZ62733.1 hypothetical protein [Leptospiraceae bacterium]
MKKLALVISIVLATAFSTSSLFAKCYGFRDADIKVCVNGDSNADRKKASETCKKVVGADCGGITGYSGSCTGPKCYDDGGNKKSNIKVD